MAIGIKYLAGSSLGTAFETGETRSVIVTLESVSAVSGYEDDVITYACTVLDSEAETVPAAFVATLKGAIGYNIPPWLKIVLTKHFQLRLVLN